jgi:hypothetical protein
MANYSNKNNDASLGIPPKDPIAGQIWYDEQNKTTQIWDEYQRRWKVFSEVGHDHLEEIRYVEYLLPIHDNVIISGLQIQENAGEGKTLTSDADGKASWFPRNYVSYHETLTDYVITGDDVVIGLDSSSVDVDICLPLAAGSALGTYYVIKALDISHQSRVVASGIDVIDGSNVYTFTQQYEVITVLAAASGVWLII